MNKFLLSFLICLFLLSSFSSAGLIIDDSNNQATNVNTTVEIPPLGDLEYITVKFCDNGKVKDREELYMRPGQTKDVCIVFFNTAQTGNNIKTLGQFSQGTLQANGVPNCSNQYSSGEFFNLISKYTSGYFNITLAPGEKAIRHIEIAVPKTMTGNINMYGCLVYQLDKTRPEDFSGIFYVVNAKASYFYIQVKGTVYNGQIVDTIYLFWQDNKILILKVIAGMLGILLIYYIIIPIKNKKHTNKKS